MATASAKFDLSESELREGSRLQGRFMRRGFIYAGLMLVMLVGMDAYFWFARCCRSTNGFVHKLVVDFGIAVAMGVGMFVLLQFILIPLTSRRRIRQIPAFFKDLTVEFDDQGFRYFSAKTQSNWEWSDLIGYRETDRILLLYPSKAFAHVVPKRIFSGAEADRLKQLVESRLKRL
jgi:hypothetical protein